MYMYMYIFIYRQSRTDQSCCFSMTKGLVLILRSHLRTFTHIDAHLFRLSPTDQSCCRANTSSSSSSSRTRSSLSRVLCRMCSL